MQQKKWKEADAQNWQFILFVANREKERYLDLESLKNFSCPDLKKLDNLWVKNSDGKYGYSVIKRIYLKEGNFLKIDSNTGEIVGWNDEAYLRFAKRVGWRDGGEWLDIDRGMTEEKYLSSEGHLPKADLQVLGLSGRDFISYDEADIEALSRFY